MTEKEDLSFYQRFGPPIIVVIAVAVMLAIAGQSQYHEPEPNSGSYTTSPDSEFGHNALIQAIKSIGPPFNNVVGPDNRDETNEYNLQAQRWLVWFSGLMVFLTFIGVLLIRGTLIETRRMLLEARSATKAAEEAVSTTREIGQQQSRAYMVAQDFKLIFERIGNSNTGGFFSARMDFSFKNCGLTPAFNMRFHYKAGWRKDDRMGPEHEPKPTNYERAGHYVGPGQSQEGTCIVQLFTTKAELSDLRIEQKRFRVYGTLIFTDIYEQDWELSFYMLEANPPELDRIEVWSPLAPQTSGNYLKKI